jgi:hypothetical protein
MDFGTFITGLIALLFCALPFLLVARNNQKQKRALQHQLFQLAASNNNQIGYFEQWNNAAIGISQDNTAVYYINTGKQPASEHVLLSDVENCFVSHDKSGKDGRTDAQRICLNFKLKTKNSQRSWAFYDSLTNPVLPNNELEQAKKWEKQVSNKLIH